MSLRPNREPGLLSVNTDISIPAKEKKKKLESICNEFRTIAFSYGFSTEDIINELQKEKEE